MRWAKGVINIGFIVHNLDLEGNGNIACCIDQKVLEGVKPLIDANIIPMSQ